MAPARDLRIFVDALVKLGYLRDDLLAAAGIRRDDLTDPDALVPCTATGAVFRRAQERRPIRNLGARVAAEVPIGSFPLLDYLVLTTDSVGKGLEQLGRYFRLVGAPNDLRIEQKADVVHAIYSGPPNPFQYEFIVTLSILHMREETENRFYADHICLAHRPDDAHEIERIVGAPVRVDAPWNGWVMSREVLDLPMRRRDPVLRTVLEQQADDLLKRLPESGGLALEVRRVLVARAAGGDMRIESVARALATSPRSLQRQLSTEGHSFQELADTTRKEAAERYLAKSSLAISEVAYLLGYSEAAAFHRAFKRWTGMTPHDFRHARV